MPLLKNNNHTLEDIFALPEGQRGELIDGIIYDMTPPGRIHQKLVGELYFTIKNYINSNHGDCEIYPAPFAVFINADDKTYIEPDLSIICEKSKLNDQGCNGAPTVIPFPQSIQSGIYPGLNIIISELL